MSSCVMVSAYCMRIFFGESWELHLPVGIRMSIYKVVRNYSGLEKSVVGSPLRYRTSLALSSW